MASPPIGPSLLAVTLGLLILYWVWGRAASKNETHNVITEVKPAKKEDEQQAEEEAKNKKKKRKPTNKNTGKLLSKASGKPKIAKGGGGGGGGGGREAPKPLLRARLKGHTGAARSAALSPDGRLAATAAADGAVLVTALDTVGKPGVQPKQWRLNIEYDHASAIKFTDNGRRLVAATAHGRAVLFFAVPTAEQAEKGIKPELVKQFETSHTEEISHILLLDVEKWLLVVTAGRSTDDTKIAFWGPRGDHLATVDPNQISNNMISATPDGRFVGAACYTTDVKLYEVHRRGDGGLERVAKAMTLQHGHTQAITALAFNAASTRALTASQDGTWAVWDIAVHYKIGEDPHLLFKSSATAAALGPLTAAAFCKAAAGGGAAGGGGGGGGGGEEAVVVAGAGGALACYRETSDKVLIFSVPNSHNAGEGSEIDHLVVSSDQRALVTVCEGDRQARLWGPLL